MKSKTKPKTKPKNNAHTNPEHHTGTPHPNPHPTTSTHPTPAHQPTTFGSPTHEHGAHESLKTKTCEEMETGGSGRSTRQWRRATAAPSGRRSSATAAARPCAGSTTMRFTGATRASAARALVTD